MYEHTNTDVAHPDKKNKYARTAMSLKHKSSIHLHEGDPTLAELPLEDVGTTLLASLSGDGSSTVHNASLHDARMCTVEHAPHLPDLDKAEATFPPKGIEALSYDVTHLPPH